MRSDVMKCEDCEAMLEEYFDGSLDEKRASAVGLHIGACAECARLCELLGLEQQVYQRYDREIEVRPELWAAIESRIRENSPIQVRNAASTRFRQWLGLFAAMRLSPALVAAIVVLAIGITVIVTRHSGQKPPMNTGTEGPIAAAPQGPVVSPGAAPTPSSPVTGSSPTKLPETVTAAVEARPPRITTARKPSAQQLVHEAEEKYLSAIAILSRDVNRRKSSIDPESLARFQSALAVIDNTINETRHAARKNPNDPIALQYLLASYSKKVDVLREMARE